MLKTTVLAVVFVISGSAIAAPEGAFIAQCGPAESTGDIAWTELGEQVEIASCAPFAIKYENGAVIEGVPVSPGSVFLPRPIDEI